MRVDNEFLENRKVGINADQFLSSPQKNKWVLLRKTALKLTKKGATRPISDFNLILEDFYAQARTYFTDES